MNQNVNREYKKYIPSYNILFSAHEKLQEYCLVIPVINEGARIHALLDRIVLTEVLLTVHLMKVILKHDMCTRFC